MRLDVQRRADTAKLHGAGAADLIATIPPRGGMDYTGALLPRAISGAPNYYVTYLEEQNAST